MTQKAARTVDAFAAEAKAAAKPHRCVAKWPDYAGRLGMPQLDWAQWLKSAGAFRKMNGHLRVADFEKCRKFPGLFRFAVQLRSGTIEISDAQRAILDRLKFDWDSPETDATFYKRLEQLTACKKQHGHCNVPRRYDEKLGPLEVFVHIQRLNRNSIGAVRKKHLDRLGFVWELKKEWTETQWETKTRSGMGSSCG